MYLHWLFTLTTLENSTKLSDKSMGFYQDYDHYNNVRYTRWPCAWPTQVSQYPENYRRQTQISPRTPGTASWLGLGQNCSPANSFHYYSSAPPDTPLTATEIPFTESLNPRQLSNWASCCHSLPLTPLQCGTSLTKIKRKLNFDERMYKF